MMARVIGSKQEEDISIAAVLERLRELLVESGPNDYTSDIAPIADLAAYDPRDVVVLIRNLPESARRASASRGSPSTSCPESRIRSKAAEMLGVPIEGRRRKAIAWSDQP